MADNNKYLELAGGSPYHDDFDVKDNFMRILFNPSRAVQARELTQLQTILQNQQKVASDFLFKENSIVDGARISINRTKPGMLVTSAIVDSSWIGETLTNDNAGSPTKQITITSIDDSIGSQIAIYYDYSGDKPVALETFYTGSGDTIVVDETFTAMVANCDEGIVYSKSQFIHVPAQEIVISNNNEFQSGEQDGALYIGYRIQEDIVTEGNQEVVASEGAETITLGEKLLDPASGSRNFNAPGAHRYRIKAVLSSYFEILNVDGITVDNRLTLQDVSYTEDELNGDSSLTSPVLTGTEFPVGRPVGETFLEEFETFIVLEDQRITRDQTEPQFGAIENLLARRTYNESGNYTVEDFNITVEPDPNDADSLIVEIGPGTAYVKGFEIIKTNSTTFSIPRGRQTPLSVLSGARKAVNRLSYIIVDTAENTTTTPDGTIAGADGFKFASGEEVLFKNGIDGTGDTIATGRIHSVERQDTTLAVYFSNVGKLSDSLSTLRSFVRSSETGTYMNVSLRSIGNGNSLPLYGGNDLPLVTRIDHVDVPESLSNFEWSVTRRRTVTAGVTAISGADFEITLTVPSDGSFRNSRPISIIYNKTQGVYLDPIENTTQIGSISEGVSATVGLVDVTGSVADGDEIVVDYLINRKNDSGDTDTFTRTKTLLEKTDTKTIAAGDNITDILELTEEDVYEVVEVKQVSNVLPELADNYSDPADPNHDEVLYPTANFNIRDGETPYRVFTHDDLLKLKFNDGQTDEFYDVGSISGWKKFWSKYKNTGINTFDSGDGINPNDGVGKATDYEITYRYFRHDNVGNAAFTVNSYANAAGLNRNFQNQKSLIPSYKSERVGKVDLIGVVDFRRKKSELATGANESVQDKVIPGSILRFDIEHNLGRFDSISLHKNGEFVVKQGIPSRTPDVPQPPENSMPLFNLYIPPYTFSANDVEVEAFKNTRYTMKDISRLESRIERLEDSVSLNLLEKTALDMKITDANGNDRFKSGIFVDNFEGLSHTNTLDDNFYVSVDRIEKVIHCPVEKRNLAMNPSEDTLSGGLNEYAAGEFQATDTKIKKYQNTITIAPTGERVLSENKTASSFLNLNPYLFYTWVGEVELTPAVDTWHEERYLPTKNIITGSWEPPEGYNPDWVVDDIDVTWVGIDPNPAPAPAPTNPPRPPSPPSAPSRRWQIEEIVVMPHIFQDIFDTISNPNSTQAQLDSAVQHAANWVSAGDQVTGDGLEWFKQAFLGNEGWWRSTDIPLEERQEALNELLNLLEFEGVIPTSANLGSNNILSGSNASSVAGQLGETEFNASKSSFHEQNSGKLPRTHEVREDRLVFDANFSEPSNSATRPSSRSGGEQHITITKVKDVLKKHTEKVSEDKIIDKTSIYWMRPRLVEFNASGLRPGMRVFAALDNKQVSIKPNTDFIDSNGNFRVDGDGNIKGWFKIPAKTFTTGTKNFLLMDAEATSQAVAEFKSAGILTTRQKTITSIRSVSVKQIRKKIEQIKPLVDADPPEIQPLPPGSASVSLSPHQNPENSKYADPVAQSFLVTSSGGCMLKSLDVYFATKSGDFSEPETVDNQDLKARLAELFPGHPQDAPQPTKPFFRGGVSDEVLRAPVTVYLVEMQDGNPTQNIVPMSKVTLPASAVNADPDDPQNGLTTFTFSDPIYLEEGEEYALVLSTPSKEYNVWVTRLGEQDLFEGGRSSPGAAVATQPYLGSVFKSQNSFTWTPDQETTLTFRLKRYVYPTSNAPKAYMVDSKNEELSQDIEANALKATDPLYLDLTNSSDNDKFTGDVNQIMTRVANIYPMIGSLTVPQTTIQWSQAFEDNNVVSSFDWIPMQNMKRNKLLNSSNADGSHEYIIDNDNNYVVKAEMSTENANVTPMIDLQQLRAIAVRNKVRGIEPFFTVNTAGVVYQTNTAYNKFDLLRDPDDLEGPLYFVSAMSGIASSTNTFKYHLNNDNVRVLEQEINLPDANGVVRGNAGVYVSNTINLKDSADDIRMVLESTEPGASFVKPYYKILDQNTRFVTQKAGTTSDEAVNGQKSQVIYARPDSGSNVINVTNRNVDGNINSVVVNGVDPETNKIYITESSRDNAFEVDYTLNSLNSGAVTMIVATHSYLLKSAVEKAVSAGTNTLPIWQSGEYNFNDVVYFNNAFWYAEGYMKPSWVAGTYNEGDRVRHGGSNWVVAVASTTEEPGVGTDWEEVTGTLYFPVGTKPSDGGQGWSKIPTAIIEGSDPVGLTDAPGIEVDSSENIWRPMVLRGTKFANNEFTDGRYYETEWVPRSNPGIEFKNFAIKLELVSRNSKVNIPKCRNVRVVATI